jgi:hypothetical protein
MKKYFVFACAALLLVGFSVPAMADVNLYGRVYFDTYVLQTDKEAGNSRFLGQTPWLANNAGINTNVSNVVYRNTAPQYPQAPAGAVTGNDDTDLIWGLDTIITRFGARFSSGKLSANVEIRPWSASYYRHWWADYNFGAWAIRIGKWWDPLFFASQGANALFGGGIAYGANPVGDPAARTPMIRIAVPLPNKLGNWYLAFQENEGANRAGITAQGVAFAATEYDISLPKIASSLRLNFAPTSWLLYGGYQTHDEVGRLASGAEQEFSIDAYVVGLSGSATFGPFYFGANIWTSENPTDYQGAAAQCPWGARYYATNNSIEDAEAWGLQLKGTFKFNDMISLELAYGYQDNERKDITVTTGRDDEDKFQQFDIVLPINIAKGFTIYPNISIYDNKDSTVAGVVTDEGEQIVYGVTWAFFF